MAPKAKQNNPFDPQRERVGLRGLIDGMLEEALKNNKDPAPGTWPHFLLNGMREKLDRAIERLTMPSAEDFDALMKILLSTYTIGQCSGGALWERLALLKASENRLAAARDAQDNKGTMRRKIVKALALPKIEKFPSYTANRIALEIQGDVSRQLGRELEISIIRKDVKAIMDLCRKSNKKIGLTT